MPSGRKKKMWNWSGKVKTRFSQILVWLRYNLNIYSQSLNYAKDSCFGIRLQSPVICCVVICLRKTSFIGHPRGKSPFIIGTRSSIGGGPFVRPSVRLWWRWLLPARFCRTRIFVTLQWSALFCGDVYKILTRATMIQKSCDILDVKNCCPQGRSIGPSNREGLSEWHMAKPHVKSRRRWYHFTFGHPLLTDLPLRSILSWRGGGEVQVDGNFCELKGVSIASTLQFHHFSFSFSVPCIFLMLCHHIKV